MLFHPFFLLFKVRCVGTAGILQPHPPNNRIRDKESSQKLRVYSPGQQKVTSPGTVLIAYFILCVYLSLLYGWLMLL